MATDNYQSKKWSPKFWSRVAGLIGILVLSCGSYTHSINLRLIDSTNAIATANQLIAGESTFRIGFVSGLMMETFFIFYAFLLFKLLQSVNKDHALIMLILALIPAPIFYINQLTQFGVLLLAKENMHQEMMFYLDLHKHGGLIISIFFGLWLLPLGYLVFKSKFLPKVLGILLMVGSLGYLINFIQGVLFPGTEGTLWTNPALVMTHIAELLLMLWLLLMGINSEKYPANNSLNTNS